MADEAFALCVGVHPFKHLGACTQLLTAQLTSATCLCAVLPQGGSDGIFG
jgi:hypothetical protein